MLFSFRGKNMLLYEKEGLKMITFILLIVALLSLVVFTVLSSSVFLVVFADVIFCGLIVYGIYKLLTKNKNESH